MRRLARIKTASARVLPRKAAMSASVASRRSFPAWIDASEHGVAFSAAVTSRVRDGLVLRVVGRKMKAAATRKSAHGPGTR